MMGVMACDRTDCEQILCDICIEGRWYVCRECAAEFRRQFGDELLPRAVITEKFVEFMETPKRCTNESREESVDEFLYGKKEESVDDDI